MNTQPTKEQHHFISQTAKKLTTNFLLFLFLMIMTSQAEAEDFDVQLTPSLYAGCYNISKHAGSNGTITLIISGGISPYTYSWLDGPTIRDNKRKLKG